jgi:hypothetical protein
MESQTHTKVHESVSSRSKDIYRSSVPKGTIVFSSCEQTFSILNNNERSSLTNKRLEDILKMPTSNLTAEYNKLVAEKRCNISH